MKALIDTICDHSKFLLYKLTNELFCVLLELIIYTICSQLDRKKFMRAVKLVLFNQIVVGGAFTVLLHPVYVWRGCSFGPELPSFHWVLFEIAIFTLVEEFGFYYSHRYAS